MASNGHRFLHIKPGLRLIRQIYYQVKKSPLIYINTSGNIIPINILFVFVSGMLLSCTVPALF